MLLEEQVLTLLHEMIGLNPASVGANVLLDSVRVRLSQQHIPEPEKFLAGLRERNQDFHSLVDAIIIPETWFFRDGGPFDALRINGINEWRARATGEPLRCLSVPCSTGEEPYSIAMSLLDGGLAPEEFRIDGVDISAGSLRRARAAVYGQYSFRSADISFRDRYFETRGLDFHLKPAVRGSVQFSQGNLLDSTFMNDGRQYDVIFCRNLLIYFDAPCWEVAVQALGRLLKDSGLLFMGHAEMLEMSAPQFQSARLPRAFAYRKKPLVVPKKSDTRVISRTAITTRKPVSGRTAAAPKPPASAPAPVLSGEQILQGAEELANQGKLADAAVACERYLASHPASARAYFLLGLIRESCGSHKDAEGFFQRALYLDARHHDAMIHLALLLERRGDTGGAAALRRRADRARATV